MAPFHPDLRGNRPAGRTERMKPRDTEFRRPRDTRRSCWPSADLFFWLLAQRRTKLAPNVLRERREKMVKKFPLF